MKRFILFILIVLPLLFTACEVHPLAGFVASDQEAEAGDEIYFTNNSVNAVRFTWDFGDGTFSDVPDPVHIYDVPGDYTVVLTVWSGTGSMDQSYLDIRIWQPTELQIDVREYYQKYPVAGASVILYPTYYDWVNQTNALAEGYTDDYGVVTFTKLNPQRYYIDVWEENHNNYTLADEDVGFIETDILSRHTVNYFTAWVDNVGAKGTKRDRSVLLPAKGRKADREK